MFHLSPYFCWHSTTSYTAISLSGLPSDVSRDTCGIPREKKENGEHHPIRESPPFHSEVIIGHPIPESPPFHMSLIDI